MILNSLKYHIYILISIYSLNAFDSFAQEPININPLTNNKSSIALKLKTNSKYSLNNSEVRHNYFETVYIGLGIFTNRTFYALNGGYSKQLNSFLSLGFSFNIYEKIKQKNNAPPPSLELTALYTNSFLRNKLFLFTGAGAVFFLLTNFGSTFKVKLDYNIFKNVYLGGEVKCYLIGFKIYETPLLFFNSTLIF